MKLLIAGGGTGGHLFPGIAIAEEFLSRDSKNEVLFIGTKKGLEAKILPQRGFNLKYISINGLKGKTFLKKIKTLILIPISLLQSFFILKQFKPDIVLGVGGYASFPIVCTAWLSRCLCLKRSRVDSRSTSVNILEQNLKPGITNRILSYVVQKIFVSFEESKAFFSKDKAIVSGNPIRKFKKVTHVSHEKFSIFIFGGSQGAHSLNRTLLEALPYLEPLKEKISLIHQTGKRDLNWVASTYFENHWKAELYDFIYDIDEIYTKSDYVISRAGASSVSELALLGKACLFIPYPYAAHGHQESNARLLERKGAARVLLDWQLNGFNLAKEIQYAYEHPEELEAMGKKILEFAYPNAAQTIVDTLLLYKS